MSNPVTKLNAETLRMRLEILRNYHYTVVCRGEERLRAAMEDYARCFLLPQEQDPA